MKQQSTKKLVLMSIRPSWVTKIFDGGKLYEYRKVAPNLSPPFKVVVYSTSPVSGIVGDVTVSEIITDSVHQLIQETISETPHQEGELNEYFGDNEIGHALRIKQTNEFGRRIELDEMRDAIELEPPQNFTYISPNQYSQLKGVL